jgi:hypothetical protein
MPPLFLDRADRMAGDLVLQTEIMLKDRPAPLEAKSIVSAGIANLAEFVQRGNEFY